MDLIYERQSNFRIWNISCTSDQARDPKTELEVSLAVKALPKPSLGA